jgi:hypothetical protein
MPSGAVVMLQEPGLRFDVPGVVALHEHSQRG